MSDHDVSTTHHTLEVAPWTQLPGGVRVGNWADVDPETGDPAPLLLLRDRVEVERLIKALAGALDESER